MAGTLSVAGDQPGEQSLPPQHEHRPFPASELAQESMWRHFQRCVTTGATPLTSGEDGRASLALVLDVVRTGRQRTAVRPLPQALQLTAQQG